MITRNYVLDGIRGVCALAVMFVHLSHFNNLAWFKNAGGAVDAFFIISGFVMMQNYQHKIRGDYKIIHFFKSRFKRLAPLNFVSSFLGLIAAILVVNKNISFNLSLEDLVESFVLAILFVPNFNDFSWPYGTEIQVGGLFPLNIPAWSLFFEWIAYLFFFLMVKYAFKYIRTIWLTSIFIYLITSLIYQMDNPGWSYSSILQGVARVLFGFFTGVTIYQVKKKCFKNNWFLILFFLCASLFLLFYGSAAFSLLNTFVFVPGTIFLTYNLRCSESVEKMFYWIGEISFPLYLIHVPVVTVLYTVIPQIRIFPHQIQICFLSVVVILTAHILNSIDKKLRKKF